MSHLLFKRNLYCIVSGIFALLMFVNSFLPITDKTHTFATLNDIPSHIGEERVNVSQVYSNHVDKVIIMVIDALRVDFIDDLNGAMNMPYVNSLLNKKEAFMVIGNVQTPTVTMPRIKAMTTGTVPSFIDVVYNLGSNSIVEDNLIQQAENSGHSVVFYGDETWLKLFPANFKRKEGTTSFFVADFTEVDNNVTRNLENELKVSDWNIMILHYLGLDHIGHLEGPRSAQVRPKLLEMDSVVQKIHQNMEEWTKMSSQQTILLICGDHGMKDSGGHGGASVGETTVPIITVGLGYSSNKFSPEKLVSQIDLVPTLSVLLGLPIPNGNIGKLIPQFLQNIDLEKRLYALYYNARQIAAHYNQVNTLDSAEAILRYEEAVRLHTLWLKSHGQTTYNAIKAEELYFSSLESMSELLRFSKTAYDLFGLVIAICIEFQLCVVLLIQNKTMKNIFVKKSQIVILTLIFVFLNASYCLFSESESALCTFNVNSLLRILCFVIISAVNIAVIFHSCFNSFFFQMSINRNIKWFLVGTSVHLISLLSSSFIEEEHQVWYFMWLTLILVVTWKECHHSYLSGCFKNTTLYISVIGYLIHQPKDFLH